MCVYTLNCEAQLLINHHLYSGWWFYFITKFLQNSTLLVNSVHIFVMPHRKYVMVYSLYLISSLKTGWGCLVYTMSVRRWFEYLYGFFHSIWMANSNLAMNSLSRFNKSKHNKNKTHSKIKQTRYDRLRFWENFCTFFIFFIIKCNVYNIAISFKMQSIQHNQHFASIDLINIDFWMCKYQYRKSMTHGCTFNRSIVWIKSIHGENSIDVDAYTN